MRAKRVDANHREILDALTAEGALVEDTHDLGGFWDALIGHHETKQLGLLEIKDGKKPPSARRLTEDQVKLWDKWAGFPMGLVCDVESALRFYKMLGSIRDNH